MEGNCYTNICRFCLETSGSNFEPIEEVTFANLDFLWLTLNLSMSEEPVMCGGCAKALRTCSDFKTKCLEIENCIVSSMTDKDSIKIDLQEVYMSKMPVKDIVNVLEDHVVCRLCLELVKDDSVIFLRNSTEIAVKLDQYFPELDLSCTLDPVVCASCQVSMQHYFSFINNCLTTEEKIMEYCKVECANSQSQIDLNDVIQFISKDFLKCKFEVDTVKTGEVCNVDSENTSNIVEMKKEILHIELDIKEESSSLESELTDENSFQNHPPSSQSACAPQFTKAKSAKYLCEICGYQNSCLVPLKAHILAHKGIFQEFKCEICPFKTTARVYLTKHMHRHKNASGVMWHRCAMCSYQARDKRRLQIHMITHKDKTEVIMYKCDQCHYETKWRSSLKNHKETHIPKTSEITMYRCEACAYEVRRKYYLEQHMRKGCSLKIK